jgi:3-oxoacyl-[acyl-carrier-protein] synthase-3
VEGSTAPTSEKGRSGVLSPLQFHYPFAMTTSDKIGILGLGAYAPERIMTNEEWTEWVDTSDEWITTRSGIKRRRIAGEDETTATMAVEAANRALKDCGLQPSAIDEIIVATDTPEVYFPDTASYVQHLLGAREVPAYDLAGSGCAGFLQALDIARSRVGAEGRTILVIGSEMLTRIMNWRDRSTCVLFGDAAGAVVVGSGEDTIEILAAVTGTDGSRAGILTLETGGTRAPFSVEAAEQGLHRNIVMKGPEVFKEAVGRMAKVSRQVLEQTGLTIEDVDLVVPHQANMRIISAVGKALHIPPEKVFSNIEDFGNTGSASVPLGLAQARDEGRISAGDLVLLTSFGAGFHWAAVLLRF